MQEINDLTTQELININAALKRVRDKNINRMVEGEIAQETLPGCTFPFRISYRNGKIEGKIEARLKTFFKKKEEMRKSIEVMKLSGKKDNDGNLIKGEDGKPEKLPFIDAKKARKAEKELMEVINEVEEGLTLHAYPLSWFLEMDKDDYYKEANKNSPVPQEFFSLMGRLIYDDTEEAKEPAKEEKKQS